MVLALPSPQINYFFIEYKPTQRPWLHPRANKRTFPCFLPNQMKKIPVSNEGISDCRDMFLLELQGCKCVAVGNTHCWRECPLKRKLAICNKIADRCIYIFNPIILLPGSYTTSLPALGQEDVTAKSVCCSF